MNQKSGRRWSATRAFLDPIRHRPNLDIVTEGHVTHIEFDNSAGKPRVTRVHARTHAENRSWQARSEIILAAGAIGSPHILQASGIGPGALLQQHNIPIHAELAGVGENLQDHLQIRTIYGVENTVTLNQRARTLFGKAAMGAEYFIRRTGPLTMPPSQLGAFAMSDDQQSAANIEWHVQPLSLDKFGAPLHKFNAITPSVCNLRPTSRGHVRLRSPSTEKPPEIKLNYLSTERDMQVAVHSLEYTRRIMNAPALAKFNPKELKPGLEVSSNEELVNAARDLGTTIFHPVGSCKMGQDSMAVVDDRLSVHHVEGLRVIDASVMPTITSGNTNAPTVMIAEQGADFIRQKYEHSK